MPTEQSLQGEEEQKSIIIQLRELLDLELAATININLYVCYVYVYASRGGLMLINIPTLAAIFYHIS